MSALQNKTDLITGCTRGIGLAIGERFAADGANVDLIGKTTEPHLKLEGTIQTAGGPEIIGEAAYRIVTKPVSFTGNLIIIDDSFVVSEGVTDLDIYPVQPGASMLPDFFVPEEPAAPEGVVLSGSLGHE